MDCAPDWDIMNRSMLYECGNVQHMNKLSISSFPPHTNGMRKRMEMFCGTLRPIIMFMNSSCDRFIKANVSAESVSDAINSWHSCLYLENQSGATAVGVGRISTRGRSDIPISEIIFSAVPAFSCIKFYPSNQLLLIYRQKMLQSFHCHLRPVVDSCVRSYIGARRRCCQMLICLVRQGRWHLVPR